jgi:hypothetical protein
VATNGNHVAPPLISPPVDAAPPADVEQPDDDPPTTEPTECICDETCINRRVLDLLLESFPEAREMRDLLVRQEEVMARLRNLRGQREGVS